MSESLPPTEDLGVVPMPSKESHMALLADIKAGQDTGFGPPEPSDSSFGPPESVAAPAPTPEPVSFTAYKASRSAIQPVAATQALAVAQRTGLSPQFAADNAEALRQAQDQSGFEDALGVAPVLAAYARQSPVHASAVKDDATVLQALEMGLADVGYAVAARRYMDNPDAAKRAAQGEGLIGYEQAATGFAGKANQITDPIDRLAVQVARSLPSVTAYGAASVLGAFAAGPAAGPAMGMGTALYQLNRGVLYRRIWSQAPVEDPNFDPAAFDLKAKEAAKKGALTGAVLGSILGDSFTRSLPFANKALQSIGQEIAAETLGKAVIQRGSELVGHTLSGAAFMAEQAVVDNATVQKATTGTIDYGKAVEAGKDAFTEGLGVAAVLSAYTPGRGLLRDLGRLREAAPDVARLDHLVDTAKDSKLAQRSPEEAQALIGQMARKGDASTVYITPEAAAQPEVAAKLVEALADEGQALAEAQASQTDLAVPTEKYLTTVAPEFHEALRDHVKLNPNGWTIKESTDFLSGPVAKLLAERTQIQAEPGPDQTLRLKDVEGRMRDAVAGEYGGTPEDWQKALTAHAADTIGRAVTPEAKPIETPAPADALAWARKLTEERTIADLQPGRYERAAQLASDKLAKIATESAQKAQEAARQGFFGAGMQRIRNAVESAAGIENLQEAGKKADVAARKLADVPQLERARDLARAQAKVQADVKTEMNKGRDYIAKRDTPKYRADLAKAAPEYLAAHDALNDAIDENTPRTKAAPGVLDSLFERMDRDAEPLGFDAETLQAILDQPRGWKGLTPPEARTVLDAVKNIRSAARGVNEITLEDRKATLREFVGEMVQYAKDKNYPDTGLPPPSRAAGKSEGVASKLAAEMRRPMEILRRLGPNGDALMDDFHRGRNRYEELAGTVGEHFYKTYEKGMPKELKRSRFDGVKGPGSPAVADDLWTRQDLWELASWWGSESGSDRIKRGLRITDGQAHEFLSQLTNAEADFIDSKHAFNDERLWPLLRDAAVKKSGSAPPKIEARPYTIRTAEGDIREMRGGYEPALYIKDDSPVQGLPEGDNISEYWGGMREGVPTTPSYFLKERLQNVARRPDLNWSAYSGHLHSVLRYLAFDDFVGNAGRVLRDPEFRDLMRRTHGESALDELRKFVAVAARGKVDDAVNGAGAFNRFIGGGFRGRVATAAFNMNLPIVLGQLSHLPATMFGLKISPINMVEGIGRAFNPFGYADAHAQSEQLPFRWNGYSQKMRAMLANIGPNETEPLGRLTRAITYPLSPATQAAAREFAQSTRTQLDALGFMPYHLMDGFLSRAIWESGRAQALDAGADFTEAAKAGDKAVERMMPPLTSAEQASVVRDRGAIGSMLLVRNFPNTLWNVGAMQSWNARNAIWGADPGLQRAVTALGATSVAAASYLGMVWSAHIFGRFLMGHGRQQDESTQQWLEREALSAPFYPVPIASDAAAVLAEAATSHKTLKQVALHGHASIQAAPIAALLQGAIRDLGEVTGGASDTDRIFAGAKLAATALRLGTWPLKPVRYGVDLMQGRYSPRGPGDVIGGGFYGKRPRQAKNPATVAQDFLSGD